MIIEHGTLRWSWEIMHISAQLYLLASHKIILAGALGMIFFPMETAEILYHDSCTMSKM